MRRINVIGMSCAGKTTLARHLAERLGYPHVELDALYWERGWTPASNEAFRSRVTGALASETFVADGGYHVARDIIWARADTVVWLDYPLRVILRQYVRRTARRLRSGEELWPGTGNRERLRAVIGRESLFWYNVRHDRGKRQRTARRLAARRDLRRIRLRTPGETRRWLEGLA